MATARGTPINTLGGCRLIYGRAFDEPRAAIKIMASESQGTTSSRVETRESPCRVTFLWQCNYFYNILAVLCAVPVRCVLCPAGALSMFKCCRLPNKLKANYKQRYYKQPGRRKSASATSTKAQFSRAAAPRVSGILISPPHLKRFTRRIF